MRRPFVWPAAGMAAGVLAGKWFDFPDRLVFLTLIFLFPLLWRVRGKRAFLPLFLIAVAGVGALRINQALMFPSQHVSRFAQESGWVSLEGRVDSLPAVKEKGKRRTHSFILRSENLVRKGKFFETAGKVQVFLFNPAGTVSFGSRIRIRGKLLLPKPPLNPGEFDYRRFLADQGIHAVMEGYGPKAFKDLNRDRRGVLQYASADFFLALIQKIREILSRQLDSLFPLPMNAFLKALILGLRKDLPEEARDDFVKTATAHLVAISGMNITLVAGSLFLIALALGLAQKGAALVGLISSVAYVFLSGAGIPVVRAGWMAGLFFTGLLLEREKDLLNSLFFAFFVILVFDPRALFQAGFQLSFLSVLSLLLFTSRGEEGRGDWLQTGVVLIGTFPLCAFYFNVFFWTSLPANALAIPFFHLGVLGGIASLILGKIPLLGWLLVQLTSLALKTGAAWIHFWAERSWGYIYLKPPDRGLILFYYITLGGLLAVRKMRVNRPSMVRPLALSLWLVAFAGFFIPLKNSSFGLTLLAAGQNEILHVEFPEGGHWLIHTGRARPSNQARWIIGPYLRRKGIKKLEGILTTDFAQRHIGGLATLLENFSILSFAYPGRSKPPREMDPLFHSGRFKRTVALPLEEGGELEVEKGAGFEVLGETRDGLLLLIHHRGLKFLILPSWKEEWVEEVARALGGDESFVDVLILPSGGHPDSANWEKILALLLPDWVVAARETPALEPVLKSLRREEIPILTLSETGSLYFEERDGRLQVRPFLSSVPLH